MFLPNSEIDVIAREVVEFINSSMSNHRAFNMISEESRVKRKGKLLRKLELSGDSYGSHILSWPIPINHVKAKKYVMNIINSINLEGKEYKMAGIGKDLDDRYKKLSRAVDKAANDIEEKKSKSRYKGYRKNYTTGVIRAVKEGLIKLRRYYLGITLSDRHIKFIAYEMSRVNVSASDVIRLAIDEYIDKKSREDERFAKVINIISNSTSDEESIREIIEMFNRGRIINFFRICFPAPEHLV